MWGSLTNLQQSSSTNTTGDPLMERAALSDYPDPGKFFGRMYLLYPMTRPHRHPLQKARNIQRNGHSIPGFKVLDFPHTARKYKSTQVLSKQVPIQVLTQILMATSLMHIKGSGATLTTTPSHNHCFKPYLAGLGGAKSLLRLVALQNLERTTESRVVLTYMR